MLSRPIIDVVIPVFNEENSIGLVIKNIPSIVREVIVVNNGSTDNTVNVAKDAGAMVLTELQKGYGKACLKGLEHIEQKQDKPEIVVFIDGDYSDYPEELLDLIKPIQEQGIDFVLGSRVKGNHEKRSMTPQQVFGNWLATRLMRLFFKAKYTDLGPFRAIKYQKLQQLKMQDTNFGWTIEMQIKAVKNNLRYEEIPVSYRVRIGKSKVSGTIKGSIMAGYKILYTIFKYL